MVAAPDPWQTVGSCKCGKVKLWQRRPGGILNFRCHCSNCRNAYQSHNGGKFSTPSADWCCNIKREGPVKAHCTCAKGIFCLRREECSECGTPIVTWGHGGLSGFAFVNMYVVNNGLPENQQVKPEANLWYDSGAKEGEDGLPTYHSDLGSLAGFLQLATCRLCRCKGGYCCC